MPRMFQPITTPVMPARRDMGIGIIGCGGVVRWGHLPAYRNAGFNVVAIASRTKSKVEAFAREFGIDHAYDDWQRLIDRPDVQVISLTYPFDDDRLHVLRAAAAAGKHVLIEKPMAHTRAAAEEMVAIARAGNIQLAVNQNARFCPQYWAAQQAVAQGLIGEVYFVSHEMQNHQDSLAWFHEGYYPKQERFQLIEYTVHHADLVRFWTGVEPSNVRCTIGRRPGQRTRGEMLVALTMRLPNAGLVTLVDDNVSHKDAPPISRFRLEGTHGVIEGTTLSRTRFAIRSDDLAPGEHEFNLPGDWFPNSFAGTMGELMRAIHTGEESTLSAADNLKTLSILFDAYADAERN